jgi:nitroreductase
VNVNPSDVERALGEPESGMSRARFLRIAGLGMGTIAVAAAGAIGYRAYDQGVLEVGRGPAYGPWASWDEGDDLGSLLGAAILAPSPHNTQPWLFGVEPGCIDLFADRSRSTGAVDPFGRELHIGLGAALENLVLAADANGFAPSVSLLPEGRSSMHVARVELARSARRLSELYTQIPHRHTNRYPFVEGRTVPQAALTEMSALAGPVARDTELIWLTSARDRGRMGELLVAATEALIADPDQSASDYAWFRQDWDELQRRRDGITMDAAGLPDLTASLAKLLPPQSRASMGESWLQATRDRHTATAASYGIVVVRDAANDAQRLEGGRLLERVHLWATGRGLGLHHMNQVTERADRERQLGMAPRFGDAIADLMPSGWQALSSFRLGYPTRSAKKSPRRPVEAVIIS